MKKRTSIAATVLATGLIAAGVWFFSASHTGTEPDTTTSIAHQWIPGAEQGYLLSIDSTVLLRMPAAMQGTLFAQPITQRLSGTLNMKVFGVEAGRVSTGFLLTSVDYRLNSRVDEDIQQGLSVPFAVIFEPDGQPVLFRFPEVVRNTERLILEECIRTFQAVLPEGHKRSWTTAEEHKTGSYLAHYRILNDGSIVKRKTLYTAIYSPADADTSEDAKADLKQSSAVLRISRDTAWIHDATVREVLTVSGIPGLANKTTVHAELKKMPDKELASNALFKAANVEQMLLAYATESTGSGRDQVAEGDQSGMNAAAASLQLERLVQQLNEVDKEGRIALLRQIEQDLQANPDLAFELIKQLREPDMTGATEAWLIHILERSGTQQAQDALVTVMNDPTFRDWNRLRAVVAMGGIENASEEAVAALLDISQNRNDVPGDVANAALLAVGSIGKSLKDTDPDRAEMIRQQLTGHLRNAGSASEAGMVLRAVENMDDTKLSMATSSYLQHDAPFVRSAAARALGRAGGSGTLDLLSDRLRIETNRQVRAEIVSAMENFGQATPASLDMVNRTVLTEAETGTRYHMTRYLADNLDEYPQGRRTLQILALKDPSSRVRKQASAALMQK